MKRLTESDISAIAMSAREGDSPSVISARMLLSLSQVRGCIRKLRLMGVSFPKQAGDYQKIAKELGGHGNMPELKPRKPREKKNGK